MQSDDDLQSPCSPTEYPNFMYGRASTLESPVPTVKPHPNFDFQEDARIIYTALRDGDKEAVINVICRRSFNQRVVSVSILFFSNLINYHLLFSIFFSYVLKYALQHNIIIWIKFFFIPFLSFVCSMNVYMVQITATVSIL